MIEHKSKDRALFNCTTNVIGGGLKNSAIFIKNALENNDFEWEFAISRPVKDLLDKWDISTEKMYLFENSPARSFVNRKRLLKLSKDLNVKFIYTMAGPAYVKFNKKHIMGISNPYFTHADMQGYRIGRNIFQIIKLLLYVVYITFYIRKADYYIFQTTQSMLGFCKRFFKSKKRTIVIPNAIGNEFRDYFKAETFRTIDFSRTIKIFCPAAGYPHKALHLIPNIAFELSKIVGSNYRFKFILTIDKESEYYKQILVTANQLNIAKLIDNVGKYSYSDSIKLHKDVDLIFVPSVVETFSASYLEAFAAKKPLGVADKIFVHDICKNGAIYVNPFRSKQSAVAINNLIFNAEEQKRLIIQGEEILNNYGDQQKRYNVIIDYLKIIK